MTLQQHPERRVAVFKEILHESPDNGGTTIEALHEQALRIIRIQETKEISGE